LAIAENQNNQEYVKVLEVQITFKRNASSATAERLFHF
jgi:hypothetical protein